MENTKEHWIKNPWVVGLILLFLTTPITALWDIVKGLPYLTTATNIWEWFSNYSLKLWWIVVYILFTSTVKAILIEIKNNNLKKGLVNIPRTYLRFTAVKYGNYKWKWEWIQDELTKDIDIANLSAVCPDNTCKNDVLFLNRTETNKQHGVTVSTSFYKCNTCLKEYVLDGDIHMIKSYIFNKIRDDSFIETNHKLPDFVKN